MARCSVIGCQNRLYKSRKYRAKLHRFPSNPERYNKWIKAVGKQNILSGTDLRLCSFHFLPNCYLKGKRNKFLHANAVPTIFPLISKRLIIGKMDQNEEYSSVIENNECRTCLCILRPNEIRHDLFEYSYSESHHGQKILSAVAEDLTVLANIEITDNQHIANVICQNCHDLVHKMKNFISLVRYSDQILRERYNIKDTVKEEKGWPKPIRQDKIMEAFDNLEVKQEPLSEDEENSSANDQNHILGNSDIKIEPEEWSHTELTSTNGLISLNSTSYEVATPDKDVDSTKDTTSHVKDEIKINGHMDTELLTKVKDEPVSEDDEALESLQFDLSLQCLLCSKDFISVSGLKAHVIAQHSYKSVRRKHKDSVTSEKQQFNYTCASCRRKFQTSTDLMVHETCHNKLVCYGCSESFDTFLLLSKHRSTCKAIASKELTKVVKLEDVQRPGTLEPEYKCTQCSETFSDTYYLNIHRDFTHNSTNSSQKQCYPVEETMETDALESLLEET